MRRNRGYPGAMNINKIAPLVILTVGLGTALTPAYSQEDAIGVTMPIPEGWRTETIPFPLSFAPDLPYVGVEELRFSPGMFDAESEQFWTYAFVWWVNANGPHDVESLAKYLENYFQGLAVSVAESKEFEVGKADFTSALEANDDGSFQGHANTFDAFVTGESVRLNIHGRAWTCPDTERMIVFFALSPQAPDHAVWNDLTAIREGIECPATKSTAE